MPERKKKEALAEIRMRPDRRMGRMRPKALPMCLSLADYLAKGAAASVPPAQSDWSKKSLPSLSRMYVNDQQGCCVISSCYHHVGLWTGNDTPSVVTVEDKEVRATYSKLKAGPGDSGCVISDVLNYWRAGGIKVNGKVNKIDGYVSVSNRNGDVSRFGIHLLGGLKLGINLPQEWYDRTDVWDVTKTRIIGGHDVLAVGYDATGVYVSTWGMVVRMTWPAFSAATWVEEAYALLSRDWYNDDDLAPSGLRVDQLKSDLDKLGGGVLPDVGPPEPPAAALKVILPQDTKAGTYTLAP